jgi:hypothetical protein
MNVISSFSNGMADLAGLLDPLTSFLKSLAEGTGLLADDNPDGWSGKDIPNDPHISP